MQASTLDKLVKAYQEQRDHIADSDLDGDCPLPVTVHLTKDEWRKFVRMQENRAFAKQALGG